MLRAGTRNAEIALAILQDEIDGDVRAALKKLAPDYTMTWMYKGRRHLFPSTRKTTQEELAEVYHIKDRRYDIYSMAVGRQTIMIELVESYPKGTGRGRHRTPLILVLEFAKGKIRTGRHYCDPAISHLRISDTALRRAYRNRKPIRVLH